jgi:predicted dehydrogenase
VRRTGRRLTTGFNRRFAPAYAELQPRLAPRPGGLTIFYRIADFERWERHDDDRILHELVHIFDLLSFLTGAEPVRVFAAAGSHPNDTVITLAFADRSVATILSAGRTGPIPKEHLEIHWEDRAVEVESFVEARFVVRQLVFVTTQDMYRDGKNRWTTTATTTVDALGIPLVIRSRRRSRPPTSTT